MPQVANALARTAERAGAGLLVVELDLDTLLAGDAAVAARFATALAAAPRGRVWLASSTTSAATRPWSSRCGTSSRRAAPRAPRARIPARQRWAVLPSASRGMLGLHRDVCMSHDARLSEVPPEVACGELAQLHGE